MFETNQLTGTWDIIIFTYFIDKVVIDKYYNVYKNKLIQYTNIIIKHHKSRINSLFYRTKYSILYTKYISQQLINQRKIV